jgi:hypothetical protein
MDPGAETPENSLLNKFTAQKATPAGWVETTRFRGRRDYGGRPMRRSSSAKRGSERRPSNRGSALAKTTK